MKSQQSFHVNTINIFFKLLPLYSTLIPGIFADIQYDYAASISLQDVRSSNNAYFAVNNQNSVATIKTLPFRLNDCTITMHDSWIASNGSTNNLFTSPLCESLLYRQDPAFNDELRYKVLFQFLFPNQYNCPLEKGVSVIPANVQMSFNFWDLDLPCDTWTYRQTILRQDKTLVKLDLKMNMLPIYNCAKHPSISSDMQNKRSKQFIVVSPDYQDKIETQIEAPYIDMRLEHFDTSAALSEIQFQPPSNFSHRSLSGSLIIVEPGAPRLTTRSQNDACSNDNFKKPESTPNQIPNESKNCQWLTIQMTRSCVTLFVIEIVNISKILVHSIL